MAAALKWPKDQVSIYCSYPRSTPVLQAMYSRDRTTLCKTKSFYLSIPKQPANTRQTLKDVSNRYESVFFKPWPPVNFHINRGDFLLKIRGGPWGGPWTPVHVLYTSVKDLLKQHVPWDVPGIKPGKASDKCIYSFLRFFCLTFWTFK